MTCPPAKKRVAKQHEVPTPFLFPFRVQRGLRMAAPQAAAVGAWWGLGLWVLLSLGVRCFLNARHYFCNTKTFLFLVFIHE